MNEKLKQTVFIIGANFDKAFLAQVRDRLPYLNIIEVSEAHGYRQDQVISTQDKFKELMLKTYDKLEEFREFPTKDEARQIRKEHENRSRYLSRQKFNIKHK